MKIEIEIDEVTTAILEGSCDIQEMTNIAVMASVVLNKWACIERDCALRAYNAIQHHRASSEPDEKLRSWVYFIQRGESGPIKIGTAMNVDKRLTQLQCGNAEHLRVLFAGKTSDGLREVDLHKKFHRLRMKGEWFKPERELLEFVECLATSDPDATQPMKRERP